MRVVPRAGSSGAPPARLVVSGVPSPERGAPPPAPTLLDGVDHDLRCVAATAVAGMLVALVDLVRDTAALT